ncbi:MAG: hypothetical protein ACLPY1_23315 [Terracidiphilus sp.]
MISPLRRIDRWYSKSSMDRFKALLSVLAVALLASAGVLVNGQVMKESSADANPPQGRAIPNGVRLKPYFSDSADSNRVHAIEFRTVDQMTPADRLQAANAQSSIGERARYADLDFNQGNWTYEQVVCPALPNHIFLRFLRNNGAGDVSVFTASIPRGEEGRVRIIPIQRRGYSLFSPAPINALTIFAFNHIRAEENPDQDPAKAPDWLGTALCYSVLAGGHPQPAQVVDNPASERFPVASVALLQVGNDGGEVLSFTDMSTSPRPTRWSMTFDRKGRLIKGGHAPAEMLSIKVEHPLEAKQSGPQQKMMAPKVKTYNPPMPSVVTQNPPPPPQTVTPANPPS